MESLLLARVRYPEGRRVVAVVGSRRGVLRANVCRYVARIAAKYPDAILVSGGAVGVDTWAETAAIEAGLAVVSFRPEPAMPSDLPRMPTSAVLGPDDPLPEGLLAAYEAYRRQVSRLAGTYLIAAYEFWPWGRAERYELPERFRSFAEAAKYRNGLVVESADPVVAFHHRNSAGTADAIRKAEARGAHVVRLES